jgi:hypothetical protein
MPYYIRVDDLLHEQGAYPGEMHVLSDQERSSNLRLMLGQTINLGNYNSLRVEIGIDTPFDAQVKSLDSVYDEMSTWIVEKFKHTVKSVQ